MRNTSYRRSSYTGAIDDYPLGIHPASLSNLQLWFDATTINTLAHTANVSQWNDMSGNGRNLTQVAETNQPTYRIAGLNGLPCIRFDGSNSYMTCTSFVSTNVTGFLVFHPFDLFTDNVGIVSFYKAGANDYNNEDCWALCGSTTNARINLVRAIATELRVNVDSVLHTPIVMTMQIKNATTTGLVRMNQVELTDSYSDANPIDSTTMIIGARAISGAAANYGKNDYSEIIFYNDAKSSSDILAIENYLIAKWRIG